MELTEQEQRENAALIIKQLGGNKFIAMTGAKNFGFDKNSLTFKIGRNSGKCNHVRITINFGQDLYEMEFLSVRNYKVKVVKKFERVFADKLVEIFEQTTGLYTSL